MPRLKLNLSPTLRRWTKTPNMLVDHLLPTLKDTELRIILVLLRETSGWNREGRPVILSYRALERKTGRHTEAISRAIERLAKLGLIHKWGPGSYRKAKNSLVKSEGQQYKDNRRKNTS